MKKIQEQEKNMQIRGILNQINECTSALNKLKSDLYKLLEPDSSKMTNKEQGLEIIVGNHLKILGISPHLTGYEYLKRGIALCVTDKKWQKGLSKLMYPTFADQFDSTVTRVERDIRYAIESSFENSSAEILERYSLNICHKETNRAFIAILSEKIRREYED